MHDFNLQAWLDSATSRERTGSYVDCKLAPVQALLQELGLTQLRPVTLAGTKGKGSTLVLLEAVLRAHGRCTVGFTSPHVQDLRERWRVDGELVKEADLAAAAERLQAAEAVLGITPTYFERCFLLACLLAAARPTAIFLCEVGLGGRLDCANALDTQLAILCHLSYDHCEILGYTLPEIAREKLAIARAGQPLLIAPQTPAGAAAIAQQLPEAEPVQWIELPTKPFRLALPGAHQQANAATALAAARLLLADEFDAQHAAVGLQAAWLPARCQLLTRPDGRRLLIDGAHNPASLATTLACADKLLRPGWQLLIGVAADKDLAAMTGLIAANRDVHRLAYQHPRSSTDSDWPPKARAWPWHNSLAEALAATDPSRDCCLTGSLYLAGEALQLLAERVAGESASRPAAAY